MNVHGDAASGPINETVLKQNTVSWQRANESLQQDEEILAQSELKLGRGRSSGSQNLA